LERNPDDQDINASLKQAREKLQDREERLQPKTEEIKSEVGTEKKAAAAAE